MHSQSQLQTPGSLPTPSQLHATKPTSEPAAVDALGLRFLRTSSDLRTNVWAWQCGACGTDGTPLDTMFRRYSKACDRCLAVNRFDFSKHGA